MVKAEPQPWLFYADPFPRESLSHYLGRVRRRNHLSCTALGNLAGIGSVVARWEKFYHNPFPSESELKALGDLLQVNLTDLMAMLPTKAHKIKSDPIRLCGVCYGEATYHCLEWQFQSVWKCDRHQRVLLSKCPKCGKKFKIPSLWEFGNCDRCFLSFEGMGNYQKVNSRLPQKS